MTHHLHHPRRLRLAINLSILTATSLLIHTAPAQSTAPAAAPETSAENPIGGVWLPPPANSPSWLSTATQLRFPKRLSDYEMVGIFRFTGTESNVIIRYHSPAMRARADIFLVRSDTPAETTEQSRELANQTLIQVIDNLFTQVEQGTYEDIEEDGSLEGKIELWNQPAAALLVQRFKATRVDSPQQGEPRRTPVKLWLGATTYQGHDITIRHIRPQETEEKGEQDMKQLIETIVAIIKDPALREELRPSFETYMRTPLTKEGQEAAELILKYLDNSPVTPVLIPTPPITTWTDEMEQAIPNSGAQLLRAYVISSATAAIEQKTEAESLNLAAQQFVRIYLELQRLNPKIQHSGIEQLVRMVERGEAASWLKKEIEANLKNP